MYDPVAKRSDHETESPFLQSGGQGFCGLQNFAHWRLRMRRTFQLI